MKLSEVTAVVKLGLQAICVKKAKQGGLQLPAMAVICLLLHPDLATSAQKVTLVVAMMVFKFKIKEYLKRTIGNLRDEQTVTVKNLGHRWGAGRMYSDNQVKGVKMS
ncbi:hypothetical protein HS088_TW12G00273 [Tripterygium wilfordii]|uniref:Uncharacterized protein n=2 Tax=Tripterygium wilfordii TaxID=458696 RepID=A0A7J7CY95_TRIWF|nr:hypothetical protein HS088_TW12G00273 [Tripterygium wilfordii]